MSCFLAEVIFFKFFFLFLIIELCISELKRFELDVRGEVKDDIWNSGMENRLIEPLFTSMAEMSNVRFTGINVNLRTKISASVM